MRLLAWPRQYLVAALAGLAQAASLADPWNAQPQWWLQIASLATLVALVQRAPTWQRALGQGWVFAIAWLCGTFWWLFISLHTYGGLPAPLAVLAILALAAFLGLYYGLACAAYRALSPDSNAQGAIIFAATWMLAELARTVFFTGFPWGAGGYAHVDGPLAVLAPWVGVFGMGFWAAGVAALLALALVPSPVPGRRSVAVGLGGVLLLVPLAWTAIGPVSLTVSHRSLSVALLQGNVPQDEKFASGTGVPLALSWYGQALNQATASLVVAPETALPLLPHQLPPGYWEALQARFANGNTAALVGIPMGSFKQGYTNSVIGLKPGASANAAASAGPYQFDKHHLVPFGEFIPPFFRWFTELMNIPLGDFNRGSVGQPSFEWQGQRLAPNICYEDLFGEELGARFAVADLAPTIFVNVSNIGWFGNTVAIDQHLQISRLRALEFERPMIRATNTGATVIIDHRGVVTHALARHTRGVLVGNVEGRTGITPYAWWTARAGLWPVWALCLFVVLVAGALRRRRG